ncbi:hypothetical protein GCM10007981_05740 [Thermocladium modestius]|uniref:Uncharacterized protein n=1 Tax=Thermocladium modestius TaxID=62609 RepID=A0A830GU42_9CREN|nr:hypothetical protein GCM10007981_05740 [Thermocladium modestius]
MLYPSIPSITFEQCLERGEGVVGGCSRYEVATIIYCGSQWGSAREGAKP